MHLDENLADELTLRGLIDARAAEFPGSASSPYVNPERELRGVCDWLVAEQNDDGLWPENESNLRFYSDSYAVRALLSAWKIFGEKSYFDAAEKWLRYFMGIQRSDGGWWVGYGWGDHDWDDDDCDQSTVYCADSGEITLALVNAYHFAMAGGAEALAGDVKASLLKFRDFSDQFRLTSGAIGLGYTHRDFYQPDAGIRSIMQGHFLPYPFATVAVGVGTYAGVYSVTGDDADWRKAMESFDWVLEHTRPETGKTLMYNDPHKADIISLHRVADWAFHCSQSPMDPASGDDPTPEPRFAAHERQKLHCIWKYLMHLIADRQSDTGEWPVIQHSRQVVKYIGALRHRVIFPYSLTSYLGTHGADAVEDDRIIECRDRALWLYGEPTIQKEHFGVCVSGVHVMPTGLWGMTMAELLLPGVTMPTGEKKTA